MKKKNLPPTAAFLKPLATLCLVGLVGFIIGTIPVHHSYGIIRFEHHEKKLKSLEKEISEEKKHQRHLKKETHSLKMETGVLTRETIALAARIRTLEKKVYATEGKIQALKTKQDAITKQVSIQDQRLGKTLLTLQTINRLRGTSFLTYPEKALQDKRAFTVLYATVPALHKKSQQLKKNLSALKQIKAETSEEKNSLVTTITRLQEEKDQLSSLLREKRQGQKNVIVRAQKAQRSLAALAKKSQSLNDLVGRLFASRIPLQRPQKGARSPHTPRTVKGATIGPLPLPAEGPVSDNFNDTTVPNRLQGLMVETRNGSYVTAPFDGVILFAGPFRSYGQLLILEIREGYHILMAGIEKLNTFVGQQVLAGEPLGSMGSNKNAGTPFGNRLYVEVRENNQPVSPWRWFARRQVATKP